jgi:hypothetical protein
MAWLPPPLPAPPPAPPAALQVPVSVSQWSAPQLTQSLPLLPQV